VTDVTARDEPETYHIVDDPAQRAVWFARMRAQLRHLQVVRDDDEPDAA
jgi:nucleotide-binding universal stress UspA family protein